MRVLPKTGEHTQLSDANVLKLIGISAQSESAFNEFYSRYRGFVSAVCKSCSKSFDPSGQLANDVFQATFIKVASNGFKFRIPDGVKKEDESLYIKSWLSRIARNELISFTRKYPVTNNELAINSQTESKKEEFYTIDSEESEEQQSIESRVLETGLQSLSEAERHVLMTYMLYYDQSQPGKHLPADVLEKLCNDLQTNAGNVRQLKLRALRKLKDICESKD